MPSEGLVLYHEEAFVYSMLLNQKYIYSCTLFMFPFLHLIQRMNPNLVIDGWMFVFSVSCTLEQQFLCILNKDEIFLTCLLCLTTLGFIYLMIVDFAIKQKKYQENNCVFCFY